MCIHCNISTILTDCQNSQPSHHIYLIDISLVLLISYASKCGSVTLGNGSAGGIYKQFKQ